jgi:hypothetical protein
VAPEAEVLKSMDLLVISAADAKAGTIAGKSMPASKPKLATVFKNPPIRET